MRIRKYDHDYSRRVFMEKMAICKRWLKQSCPSTQVTCIGQLDQGWNMRAILDLGLRGGG